MKALKLFLIALVAGGAIYGLLLLTQGGSRSSGGGEDVELYKDLAEELKVQWEATTIWSRTLFDESLGKINHHKSDLGSKYETLQDYIAENSIDRLYDGMMGEFSKANCVKSSVDASAEGLSYFLSQISGYETNERVKTMKGTHKLYTDILGLVAESKKNITAKFDFDTDMWNDYNAYERRLMKRYNDLKGNIYYQNISHITEITDGLNQVPSNLARVKSNFKDDLAGKIIAAYNAHEKNDTLRDRLADLNRNFIEMFGSQGTLRSYVLNY
ncbi:MAG: hypothetical protein K6G08_06870 [Prevotella sp.]|nr:hypothetical protein [Prevotella sp.]